ncbi:MAG TPA: response regulator transcription factor [Actinomycetota bacterium]|nr:response regulator transcription factor [Actinomycetota bacterium]
MSDGHVLIVDDEAIVRDVLTRYLEREGFQVDAAADGEAALEIAARSRPDIVVLDLMLPKVDGLEVFRRLRDLWDVPVVMLTAKGEEIDRLVGLELGADDYVSKPFSPREVVARIRAILRRSERGARDGASLVMGRLEIDRDRREVRRDAASLHLTRKEYDLLELLASHPGRTFTRTDLLEKVWDFAWDGDSSTVTVHIRRLREKIEDDPSEPRHLVTVWGVGYRFEP